jgi:NDP-sugar pyrophosphorylase family protein
VKQALPTVAILAGGLARRMRPLTERLPKALLEVAGEPFIAHQLRLLRREGAAEVVLCLGYLGEQVEAFVGDGGCYGLAVRYSREGARLGSPFLVLYGDSYLDIAFAPVLAAFVSSGLDGLMTVYRNDGAWDASNVVFEDGRIRFYSKKVKRPDMRHIDYGLGILKAEVLRPYPADQPFDLAQVYATLVETQRLAGYEVTQRFYEIGSPAGLAETAEYLRRAAAAPGPAGDADGST